MGRSIRSLPTFLYGLALLSFGLALVAAQATPLGLAQTGSVAALAAGAAALVAVVAAPRPPSGNGP